MFIIMKLVSEELKVLPPDKKERAGLLVPYYIHPYASSPFLHSIFKSRESTHVEGGPASKL